MRVSSPYEKSMQYVQSEVFVQVSGWNPSIEDTVKVSQCTVYALQVYVDLDTLSCPE